ncbi:MAG: glycosyltransferase family 9 protein [Chthoniobacterales bacterium]
MNRILVIRGGAIGDFVLTLPAIKLLRENFPDARMEILGHTQIAALAEKRFYADAVRSIEDGALAASSPGMRSSHRSFAITSAASSSS